MKFLDVIGQADLKEHLVRAAEKNKIAHALLFLGAEGSGGLPLALATAQFLCCESPSDTDSCGTCPSCIKSARLQHPDIHFAYPVVKKENQRTAAMSADFAKEWISLISSNPYITEFDWLQGIKAGNRQGNISAEECRHIIRSLNLKPYEAPYKILILWKPEVLGLSGNILLKLIEEPPGNTVLMLVAENQEDILPTILSRTQLVKIPPLTDEEITEALIERHGIAKEDAIRLAFLSGGSYNQAVELIGEDAQVYSKLWLAWLIHIMKPQPVELLRWIDQVAIIGREQQKQFFEYCLHFIRETTINAFSPAVRPRVLPDEVPVMRSLMKYITTLEQLERLNELFEQATYFIERNANPKITLMDMSIRIQKVLKGIPEPLEVNPLV